MMSRKSIHIYIPKYFMAVRNCRYFSSLVIRGTSLFTCSYIGKLRNDRKFKCENKPSILFILILRPLLIMLLKK